MFFVCFIPQFTAFPILCIFIFSDSHFFRNASYYVRIYYSDYSRLSQSLLRCHSLFQVLSFDFRLVSSLVVLLVGTVLIRIIFNNLLSVSTEYRIRMTTLNLFNRIGKQTLGKFTRSSKESAKNFSVSSYRKMRFVQYKLKTGGQQQLGAQLSTGGDIIDISAVDSSVPNSLVKFLANGNGLYEKAKR